MKRILAAIVLASSLALTACGGGHAPTYFNDYGSSQNMDSNYNQYRNDCLDQYGYLKPTASYSCRNSRNNPTNTSSPFYSKNKSSPYYKTQQKSQQKSTPFKSNSSTTKQAPQKSSPFKSNGGSSFKSGGSSFKSGGSFRIK